MSKKINAAAIVAAQSAYRSFLGANESLASVLEKIVDDNGKAPDAFIDALAETHARYYKCAAYKADNGGWRFAQMTPEQREAAAARAEKKGEEAPPTMSAMRDVAAQRKWDRVIAKYHNVEQHERTGREAAPAQKDEVAALLAYIEKKYAALSRGDKMRFTKTIHSVKF